MIQTASSLTRQTPPAETKTVRCAIYCRKSHEEGLEQEFNSLDAQRESAAAYNASQRHAGWHALRADYSDGGFTGGNMERPGLKRLLADIEAERIDCVVVYKVDRLSRSLMDFAQLIGLFEQHNVAFVSVTQHFDTSTSIGDTMDTITDDAHPPTDLARQHGPINNSSNIPGFPIRIGSFLVLQRGETALRRCFRCEENRKLSSVWRV